MNCNRCNTRVEKEWNYCPKCGLKLRGIRFQRVIKRVVKKPPRIKIKVNRNPETRRMIIDPSLEVIEPETKKEKNRLIIEMPGVKSLKEVFFRRAGNTIELNAQTKNKRYFKILNLEGRKIKDKMFADGKLIFIIDS